MPSGTSFWYRLLHPESSGLWIRLPLHPASPCLCIPLNFLPSSKMVSPGASSVPAKGILPWWYWLLPPVPWLYHLCNVCHHLQWWVHLYLWVLYVRAWWLKVGERPPRHNTRVQMLPGPTAHLNRIGTSFGEGPCLHPLPRCHLQFVSMEMLFSNCIQHPKHPLLWPCAVSTVTTSTSTSTNAETRSSMSWVTPTAAPTRSRPWLSLLGGVVFDLHDVFVGYEAYQFIIVVYDRQLFYFKLLQDFFCLHQRSALGSCDQFSRVIISLTGFAKSVSNRRSRSRLVRMPTSVFWWSMTGMPRSYRFSSGGGHLWPMIPDGAPQDRGSYRSLIF